MEARPGEQGVGAFVIVDEGEFGQGIARRTR